MLDAFLQGGLAVFQPAFLFMMLVGVVLGTVIGILPGIGAIFALSVMIPFVYRMPPELGMGFLVAMVSVTATSGAITSILLGIPGTGINVATVMDGFPMTKKGEGSRALGACVASSMFGGLVGALLAIPMIPLVVPLVMALGTGEMVLIIALGLVCMATVLEGSAVKGLISGLMGVILALIGTNSLTGTSRFTFGNIFLYDGLGLVPVVLGLWGVASLLEMMAKGQTAISKVAAKAEISGMLRGIRDVFRHKWLWLRSTVIGYVIGVIPGVGGAEATYMAYGHAKQTSKHPEEFGTGTVEGVIAPESANNSMEGGALLTTMVFGIPGSPHMALLIGAFFMVGLIPGPPMVREHLPLTFTLLVGVAVANVMAGILCLTTSRQLVKVAFVPLNLLFPMMLAIMFAAAFAAKVSIFNLLVVTLFGVIGFLMGKFGYSRPALMLGFVLGRLFEEYLNQAIEIHGPLFFLSPTSLVLTGIIVLAVTFPYWKGFSRRLRSGEARPT